MPKSKSFFTELGLKNFRKFDALHITKLRETTLIVGPNGYGKTTIIWAISLFLRGYNALCSRNETNKVAINPDRVADLLNYSALAHTSLRGFARDQSQPTASISAKINGILYTCTVNLSGELSISPVPTVNKDQKIGYAFMSLDPLWLAAHKEPVYDANEPIASGVGNTRARYKRLSEQSKKQVLESLRRIFGTKYTLEEAKDTTPLYLVDENKQKIEMVFAGAALRKVFTCLVLLFALLETHEKERIFLIEEPEAQLYPLIQQTFVQELLYLCKDRVQIIMTSNAKETIDLFAPKNIFVLNLDTPPYGKKLSDDTLLHDAVDLNVLGAKRLVLCEGVNAEVFLSAVARLFQVEFALVQPYKCSGRIPNMEMVIRMLKNLHPHNRVYILIDRDFLTEKSLEEKKEKLLKAAGSRDDLKVLAWDAPSIESYLFIHEVMKNQKLLAKLDIPENQKKLWDTYSNYYFTSNSVRDPWAALQKWQRAMALVQEASGRILKLEEVTEIAQVVQGHTWVAFNGLNTPDLIRNMDSSIQQHCPSLKAFLLQITEGIN